MKDEVLIRLVPNSGQLGVCRGCGTSIVWMATLNGKRMPMNAYAMPRERGDGADMYSAGDAHWASCPARSQFDKRTRTNA